MAIQTTTFKGARYVVKFHDPIEWADTESYEAIEAVQHEAFTYISKQPVPAGVQIDNEEFWLLWADPNAQMEQLRQLVSSYVDNVEELSGVVGDLSNELGAEIEAREAAITAETQARENADAQLETYLGNQISNTAISIINQLESDIINSSGYLYIAGITGDDANNGTQETPFKTIEGAFNWYQKHNKSDIRLQIIEPGTYDFTFCNRLVNCQIHLESINVTSGQVIINLGEKAVYNSYIHFQGAATNHMIINIDYYHQDVGAVYFNRCDINVVHMANSWCGITFTSCTVTWLEYNGNNSMTYCDTTITSCIWINQNISAAYYRCTGGQLNIATEIHFDGIANRNGAMFYLQNCVWNCAISNIIADNNYNCNAEMIHSEWTNGIASPAAKTAAETIFTALVAGRGYYSTVNALIELTNV